ncbi:MAG: hypothetical protein ACOYN3_05770 [Acidimicrobiia bacterium]
MTSVAVLQESSVVAPAAEPVSRQRLQLRTVAVVGVWLVFLGLATQIWLRRNHPFVPFADHALLEMQLRDLATHPPTLGAYSRFGWHHPGPLATYLIGVIYWATGGYSVSMWIAGAFLNAAACTAVVCVAFRRLDTWRALGACAVLGVYLVYLGPLGLTDPWNPIVSILPFLAFILCCWDAWCGGRWGWLAIVAFGSFALQSHLQYAAPVACCVVATIGATGWQHRRAVQWRSIAPVAGSAIALAGVVWALPIGNQLWGSGNMHGIVRYVTRGSGPQHAWRDSADFAAREVVAPLRALAPGGRINVLLQWPAPSRGLLVMTALVLVVTTTLAIRHRSRDGLALLALGSLVWVSAVVQCTRMERELWPYLVAWISALFVVAGVAVITVIPGVVARVSLRYPRVQRGLAVTLWIGVALVVSAAPWRPLTATTTVGPLAVAARPQLPFRGAILVTDGGAPVTMQLSSLVSIWVRDGFDVRVPNDNALIFGARTIGAREAILRLQLVVVDPAAPLPEIPNATPFASAGTLALYRIA